MDDVIKAMRDQYAQAQQISAQFRAVGAVSAGVDGPVAIVMNFDGAVIWCRVHPQWRQRLTGGDLGTAVVGTIQQGHRMILEKMETGTTTADSGGRPPARPAPDPVDPAEFTSYLRNLLVDVQNSLPEVTAKTLNAAGEVSTVEGAGGAVIATTRAGALVRLDIKPTWLRRTSHSEIGRVLTEVLARALPGSMKRMLAELDSVGRVAEFRALMADPGRLLANLGLGGGGMR